MGSSTYLQCETIESLRYKILSSNISRLSQEEQQRVKQLTSYLLEEATICSSFRQIHFSDEELNLIKKLLDDESISSVSDLQKIVEET